MGGIEKLAAINPPAAEQDENAADDQAKLSLGSKSISLPLLNQTSNPQEPAKPAAAEDLCEQALV